MNAAGLALAVRMTVRELAIPVTPRRVVLLGGATLAAAPFTTVAVTSEMTFLLMVSAPIMCVNRPKAGIRMHTVDPPIRATEVRIDEL